MPTTNSARSSRWQSTPRPRTVEEYLTIRPQLVDTLGRPLALEDCPDCGHDHYTVEPCAGEVECPKCGSTAARCRRPSGHEAAAWHAARAETFEALCAEREAAGMPQVARWAEDAPGDDQPMLWMVDQEQV